MSEQQQGDFERAQRRRRRRTTLIGALRVAGVLAAVHVFVACHHPWVGEICDDNSAKLEVYVYGSLCRGEVTVSGPCSEPDCLDLAGSGSCSYWDAWLDGPAGSVCTVTLTLPDGGKLSTDVVWQAGDEGCIRDESIEFR